MSEEWISARDAAEAMWPGKKPAPVPNAITKYAEAGVVKAWAVLQTRQGREGRIELPPGPIPKEFWGGRSMVPDWDGGVFTATVQQDGYAEEWKAFGVRFEPTGVEAMAPPKASEVAASAPAPAKNRGGSPVTYDWVVAVGTLIFQWVEKGTWHPKDEKEVRKCLRDYFAGRDQYPDSKMLKNYAEWLFQEFEKRKE